MKSTETGRSMLEMIGVLGIIGVLSIGSLAAYDYAKARARTTSIIDVASKLLAVARVKGKTVSTFSEKMEYVIDNYQMAAMATVNQSTGEGIVTVCGCDFDDTFEEQLKQVSGAEVSLLSEGVNELNRLKCKGENNTTVCFKLTFPGGEEMTN